ncbi:MAG: cytochrome c [Verrucomicrobiota bacterium]|nr:cytochrome c [Verrucomicrobiota bacterium]
MKPKKSQPASKASVGKQIQLAEPTVSDQEIPIWFFVLLAILLFWGLVYLDQAAGGFNSKVYPPYKSIAAVRDANPKSGDEVRLARGEQHYKTGCVLCHQPNGLGTPGQFPPLAGSEWVTGSPGRLIRIPLHGLAGPIKVKGEDWNAAMPAMGAAFTDEQLADLLTYIRQTWGNKAPAISTEQVKAVRSDTGSRTEPWSAAELSALPE